MTDNMGEIAGIIWQYLNKNGPTSFNQLSIGTKLNKNNLHRGIGWLLKEDKLNLKTEKRAEIISLK